MSPTLAGPPLGLSMFQSANVIGIEPVISMTPLDRWAVTGKVSDRVTRRVRSPVAVAVTCVPSDGRVPRSIGLVRVNVEVG